MIWALTFPQPKLFSKFIRKKAELAKRKKEIKSSMSFKLTPSIQLMATIFKKLLTLSSKRKRNPFKLLTQEMSKNSLNKNPEK